MSVQPLSIVARRSVPLDHLVLDLSVSACGARMWALRTQAGGAAIASGHFDDSGRFAGEFAAAATAVHSVTEETSKCPS